MVKRVIDADKIEGHIDELANKKHDATQIEIEAGKTTAQAIADLESKVRVNKSDYYPFEGNSSMRNFVGDIRLVKGFDPTKRYYIFYIGNSFPSFENLIINNEDDETVFSWSGENDLSSNKWITLEVEDKEVQVYFTDVYSLIPTPGTFEKDCIVMECTSGYLQKEESRKKSIESNVSANAGNISSNAENISTNTENISTNAGNIAVLQNKVNHDYYPFVGASYMRDFVGDIRLVKGFDPTKRYYISFIGQSGPTLDSFNLKDEGGETVFDWNDGTGDISNNTWVTLEKDGKEVQIYFTDIDQMSPSGGILDRDGLELECCSGYLQKEEARKKSVEFNVSVNAGNIAALQNKEFRNFYPFESESTFKDVVADVRLVRGFNPKKQYYIYKIVDDVAIDEPVQVSVIIKDVDDTESYALYSDEEITPVSGEWMRVVDGFREAELLFLVDSVPGTLMNPVTGNAGADTLLRECSSGYVEKVDTILSALQDKYKYYPFVSTSPLRGFIGDIQLISGFDPRSRYYISAIEGDGATSTIDRVVIREVGGDVEFESTDGESGLSSDDVVVMQNDLDEKFIRIRFHYPQFIKTQTSDEVSTIMPECVSSMDGDVEARLSSNIELLGEIENYTGYLEEELDKRAPFEHFDTLEDLSTSLNRGTETMDAILYRVDRGPYKLQLAVIVGAEYNQSIYPAPIGELRIQKLGSAHLTIEFIGVGPEPQKWLGGCHYVDGTPYFDGWNGFTQGNTDYYPFEGESTFKDVVADVRLVKGFDPTKQYYIYKIVDDVAIDDPIQVSVIIKDVDDTVSFTLYSDEEITPVPGEWIRFYGYSCEAELLFLVDSVPGTIINPVTGNAGADTLLRECSSGYVEKVDTILSALQDKYKYYPFEASSPLSQIIGDIKLIKGFDPRSRYYISAIEGDGATSSIDRLVISEVGGDVEFDSSDGDSGFSSDDVKVMEDDSDDKFIRIRFRRPDLLSNITSDEVSMLVPECVSSMGMDTEERLSSSIELLDEIEYYTGYLEEELDKRAPFDQFDTLEDLSTSLSRGTETMDEILYRVDRGPYKLQLAVIVGAEYNQSIYPAPFGELRIQKLGSTHLTFEFIGVGAEPKKWLGGCHYVDGTPYFDGWVPVIVNQDECFPFEGDSKFLDFVGDIRLVAGFEPGYRHVLETVIGNEGVITEVKIGRRQTHDHGSYDTCFYWTGSLAVGSDEWYKFTSEGKEVWIFITNEEFLYENNDGVPPVGGYESYIRRECDSLYLEKSTARISALEQSIESIGDVRTVSVSTTTLIVDLNAAEDFQKICGTDQSFNITNVKLKKVFRMFIKGGSLADTLFTGYTEYWLGGDLKSDYDNSKFNYLWCEIRSAGSIYLFWGE